uniref:TIR domain-containing protein n=1 Tax=Leptobrachium leishanense TaxID=445787 RepID=A0A8C5LKL0_9ANUR
MKWAEISLDFFVLMYVFMPIQSEDGSVEKSSTGHLEEILLNASHLVTFLDLSQKYISLVDTNKFRLFPKLKSLNLSHNLIEELDFEVFRFNTALEQLDLSHNKLSKISCSSLHFIKNVKKLNLSYTNSSVVYLCKEITVLSNLEYLGLSAERIQKQDFLNLAQRQLQCVFLGLENLREYKSGSIQLLNTSKLHVHLSKYINNQFLFYDALATATTLEISEIECSFCDNYTSLLSMINKNSRVRTLILSNTTMPWKAMREIFLSVWRSSVEHFYVNMFTLINEFTYIQTDFSDTSLKSLVIDHIITKVFYFTPPHPLNTFSEMLLENFTFSNADITHLFCPPRPSIFRFLNLSKNRITDEIFQQCDNLTALELLNLCSNKLEKLSKISSMTSNMKSLKHLDLSQNILQYEQGEICNWADTLVILNLSENRLMNEAFACLPINIQVLDLTRNQITIIPKTLKDLTFLRELNLSFNRLRNIPDCHLLGRSLRSLRVDGNFINSPSVAFYQNCHNITKISAGHNPYQCDCELRGFRHLEHVTPGRLAGWPDSYRCEYPEDFKGLLLKDFYLSEISCNIYMLLAIVLSSVVIALLLIIFSCLYFDLPWYIRMLYQWIRTKHRVRNAQDLLKDKCFHAFVSYCEEDSMWVRNTLIPNLERGDGTIKICYHERHFVPGKAIVDNIMDSIEKSFKSIFVLSPNFVQSEWCHYELYFAQHALFGRNYDNLILILLNPIPDYLIPKKFQKLKTIMKHRTYLEWPKEKTKHGLFWATLRDSIHVNLPTNEDDV